MISHTLGNQLFRLVRAAKGALFNQGELAQLTYGAFDLVASNVQKSEAEPIEISYPVGYKPDKTAILSTKRYSKQDLLNRYQFLAFHQMPMNGIAQLVTITESLLGDILRSVVVRYPHKLGGKRTISLHLALEAQSIEEVHLKATDSLLNELSYKSPAEFAEALEPLLSINVMQCPAFHRYIELKATRDIHVHNRGVVNETYLKKSGSHARASKGTFLPVDITYFLESYEACIQITEWLEAELDQRWNSSEREAEKTGETKASETLTPTGPTDSVPSDIEQQPLPTQESSKAKRPRTKQRLKPVQPLHGEDIPSQAGRRVKRHASAKIA